MSWSEVCQAASQFEPLLERDWPDYFAEMNGMPTRIVTALSTSRIAVL